MKKLTLLLGVDKVHLAQLSYTWPTWVRHKQSLLNCSIVIFHDDSVDADDILDVVGRNRRRLNIVEWPPEPVVYDGVPGVKWQEPQRYKMLSGFVHVPNIKWLFGDSYYLLKLDTDVVATGQDNWIDENWFDGQPAIISHPWTFTKPADQMLTLDRWVVESKPRMFAETDPLNLVPKPGFDRLGHKRIISWCAIFDTAFVRACAMSAKATCGPWKLPVPSQDGYLWYCATRLGRIVRRVDMKRRGWQQWHTSGNVRKYSEMALIVNSDLKGEQ